MSTLLPRTKRLTITKVKEAYDFKMNTRDYITKLTTLRRNNDVSSFRVLVQHDLIAEENRRAHIPPPRPAKNFHLAVFDDEPISPREHSSMLSSDSSLDTANIVCSVLEAYCGEVPDDKAITDLMKEGKLFGSESNKSTVDNWLLSNHDQPQDNLTLFKASSVIPSDFNSTNENSFSPRNSKSKTEKRGSLALFSKNILMRSLLKNKMESMSLGSSSSSGKDHDSGCKPNTPEFVEMEDDPDVLLRPQMMDKGVLEGKPIDDGYRFAHHGLKKTTTARRYLLDSIDDGDFFIRKESVLNYQ